MAAAPQDWENSLNPIDHMDIDTGTSSGSKSLTCKHCNKELCGGGTRAYVHLTGDGKGSKQCPNVPPELVIKLKVAKKRKDEASAKKQGTKRPAADMLQQRLGSHAAAGPGPSSLAQQQQHQQQRTGQQSVSMRHATAPLSAVAVVDDGLRCRYCPLCPAPT